MFRSSLLAALAGGLLLAGAAPALAAADCPRGFTCSKLTVPLDRSGAIPGTIDLFVARDKASAEAGKPALISLSGGPGQSAIPFAEAYRQRYKPVLDRYQLVVFDQRGTGRSGVIDCPLGQRMGEFPELEEAAAAGQACGDSLGARAGAYPTAASADDIDAIRASVGAEQVALVGVSYGTHVIQRFALAHPDRLDRAVLDSVVGPGGVNQLQLDTYAAVPRVLDALQRGAVAQTAQLVQRLGERPVRGSVYDGRGRRSPRTLRQTGELLNILIAGDLDALVRGEFPASVAAANRGDAAPLLRLAALTDDATQYPIDQISFGLYFATSCADTRLPWAQSSDPATRPALLDAAIAAVDPAAVAPFDVASVRETALAGPCLRWPAIGVGPDAVPEAYPSVPALLLAGESDLRTPVESARLVQAKWPGAGLITVPGTGHSVMTGDGTNCVTRRVIAFLGGGAPADHACQESNGLDRTAEATFPTRVGALKPTGGRGRAARAFTAGLVGFRDAQEVAAALSERRLSGRTGGLRGGSVRWSANDAVLRFDLDRYSYMPGIRLTGFIAYGTKTTRARVRVAGRVRGTMRYVDGQWHGRFGGHDLVERR